jgi:4-amino-4-deoxy-L-arabinose transferase-like glycosyltransferase
MLVALLLGLVWAGGVPLVTQAGPFENWQPDEASHALTVRWWAEHGRLPPYNGDYAVSVHPPLYHMTATVFWLLGGAAGARFFSVLLGTATVWFTFRATRTLYGREVAELAAWLVALVPMRASLAGGISNENLTALAAAAALAALAEQLRGRERRVPLALWCAVGVGSKLTCLGLFPAVAVALGLRSGPGRAVKTTLVLLLTTLITTGWWFVANQNRCGDMLCKAAADRLWDDLQPGYLHFQTTRGFSAGRYLVKILTFGWRSFWGAFDGLQKHLPLPVFLALLVGQGLALRGACRRPCAVRRAWLAAAATLLVTTTAFFILFNWRHYSPQGRYFYVMLVPFGAITGYGYLALWPPRWRRRAAQGLVAALLALNLWCLWHYLPGS